MSRLSFQRGMKNKHIISIKRAGQKLEMRENVNQHHELIYCEQVQVDQ